MPSLENTSARVILKPGRDKSLKNRHPWVFSGGIAAIEGEFAPGDILPVFAAKGNLLGKGFVNPASQIRVRMLTIGGETVDAGLLERRLGQAQALREQFLPPDTDAYRLVHGEADLLPGLIIDRYGDNWVVQFHALGMARLKPQIVDILKKRFQPNAILDRCETKALTEEGLTPTREVLHGKLPEKVRFRENNLQFYADLLDGQKTGFFLDQRDNRALIGNVASGKRLLNCFSYTGGFSIYAAVNGASTTSLDISEPAIALAQENFALNGLDAQAHRFITANVFDFLRQPDQEYDVIVLDPPAFVKSKKHIDKGARGYKDINRLAIKQVADGGLVLTCSCSPFVDWHLFQQIVFSAAQEAGRQVQILARPGQPADHPVSIFHPEGEYLKTLLLRVVEA